MTLRDAINECLASDGRLALFRVHNLQIRVRAKLLADVRTFASDLGWSRWSAFFGFSVEEVMADDWQTVQVES